MSSILRINPLWTAVLCLAPACSTVPPSPSIQDLADEINATRTTAAMVLAPGDELAVTFTHWADWDHETQVLQDGTATFLSLDIMQVAGMTLEGLDQRLTAEYAKNLRRPDLTIQVTAQVPREVIVLGQVQAPGPQTLGAGRLTLVEAIGRAGGPVEASAFLDHTMIVRWLPQENRKVAWKVDASVENWSSSKSILLQPFDLIYVPETPIVKANTWVDQYIRQMIPTPQFFVTRR